MSARMHASMPTWAAGGLATNSTESLPDSEQRQVWPVFINENISPWTIISKYLVKSTAA